MDRIIGSKEVLDKVKNAKPGDPKVYVSLDAVYSLPEQFEIKVSEVLFDPKKDWSSVGNDNFMPNPKLVYDMAEATGVNGYEAIDNTAPVYMEVNVNEIELLPGYQMVNMCVGYKSVKRSWTLNEDGTQRESSTCTVIYNAWDRASLFWSGEEKDTEGYSSKKVETKSNGSKFVKKFKKGGQTYDYFLKYDTTWKRKEHFKSLMKFALKIAETQAFFKTIRELAGMPTGYKEPDFKDGYMIFSKIRKSEKMLKLEAAAHLRNIENRGMIQAPGSNLLFQSEQDKLPEPDLPPEPKDITPEKTVVEDIETADSLREKLVALGESCEDLDKLEHIIEWLEAGPDLAKDKTLVKFNSAIKFYDDHKDDTADQGGEDDFEDQIPF